LRESASLSPEPHWESRIDIGRGELFVRRYGTAGPHVVVIHGGPDWDHGYLVPYLLPLAGCCQLTFFDLRGCGRSSHHADAAAYHPDEVVGDIKALQDRLDLRPMFLLGFSFGGRLALRFLDCHPERVGGLVLASTTAYTGFEHELEAWPEYRVRRPAATLAAQLSGSEPSADTTRAIARAGAALDVYDDAARGELDAALGRVRFSGEWLRAWEAGHLAAVEHPDYAARLRSTRTPTLIVHGEKDMRFPISVARRLHAEVPHSQLEVLARTGHMAQIEAPREWIAAVRRFLCPGFDAAPQHTVADR
jgi:pimeloyl-ACP methyl ester carboxylesterase